MTGTLDDDDDGNPLNHPAVLVAAIARINDAEDAYRHLNANAVLELPYCRNLIALLVWSLRRDGHQQTVFQDWETNFLIGEMIKRALPHGQKFARRIMAEVDVAAEAVTGAGGGELAPSALDQHFSNVAARELALQAATIGFLAIAKHLIEAENETPAAA
ncbi:hypothetical protein LGR54_20810 [Ancylobacter sp. Lp-2]|uniref:hypothetical protein n=1 Tax=Ancylobacter sp. Lp-2 TaxID=2881339 RepID=UPI001E33AC1A|nr:hypothetical protein [Ancylobacter sp. Lp-2]MCB4771055.1 hypothetical protein [Ancylobacter sp. Lp-2]